MGCGTIIGGSNPVGPSEPEEEVSRDQFYVDAELGLVTWKARLVYLNTSARTIEIHIDDSISSRATLYIAREDDKLYDQLQGYNIGKNGSIVRLEAKVNEISIGMLRGDLIKIIFLFGVE